MSSTNNNNGSSPLMLGTGFSEDDLHDLLGAMDDGSHVPANHFINNNNNNSGNSNSSNSNNSAEVVEAAKPPPKESVSPSPAPTESTMGDSVSTNGTEVGSEARALARSERKRSRERQRRSDANRQFSDLSCLLRRIEAEDVDEKCMLLPLPSSVPTNRVDLVARTIAVLERVHEANKKRKNEILELQKMLEDARKIAEDTAARLKEATLYQQNNNNNKSMVMMVPMMINPDAMNPNGNGSSVASVPPMISSQLVMPQMMGTVQAPAGAASSAPIWPGSFVPPAQFPSMIMPVQQQNNNNNATQQTSAAAPPAAPSPPPSPQPNEKSVPNVSGGNLAHCA